MSQRAASLVIGLVGVLFVVALIVLGIDIYRAAATGPRWRRRLLSGGLALLSVLGLPACGSGEGAGGGGSATKTTGQLSQAPEWQRLAATWREASEVASGRRGAYPFDEAGKKRLLAALAAGEADIGALQKAGLLTEPEAGLLKLDLGDLTLGVQAKRPTEMRMAECYKPMGIDPGRENLSRLRARLPLLTRLLAEQKLQQEVVQKVLVSVERDIAELGKKEVLDKLPEAQDVRNAAADAVQKLKSPPAGEEPAPKASLDNSADWKVIADAWAGATPLAKSGQSTTAQRKEVEAKLTAATESARRLAAAGLLCNEEAELLAAEAEYVLQDIRRNPPTDFRGTCYKMALFLPAAQSLGRLAKRLPLVEKLVAGGKVHEAACAAVVTAMEADLATLGDPKEVARLPEADRAKAQETAKQAREALQKLDRLLGPRGTCYYYFLRLPKPGHPNQLRRGQRLAQLDALEREGKLQPAVAALLREGIEREGEGA